MNKVEKVQARWESSENSAFWCTMTLQIRWMQVKEPKKTEVWVKVGSETSPLDWVMVSEQYGGRGGGIKEGVVHWSYWSAEWRPGGGDHRVTPPGAVSGRWRPDTPIMIAKGLSTRSNFALCSRREVRRKNHETGEKNTTSQAPIPTSNSYVELKKLIKLP